MSTWIQLLAAIAFFFSLTGVVLISLRGEGEPSKPRKKR